MRRGSGVEAEREKECEEMAFVPSYLLRGVFIHPTVFPHIHYLHTLLRNVSCERAPGSYLPMLFSSFFLFLSLFVSRIGRPVGRHHNHRPTLKRHGRIAAAAAAAAC